MTTRTHSRRRILVEALEGRWLLSGEAWGTFPKLIGQDLAAANFPNLTGAGTSIAILDTGIDYTHPALGGGFGPGYKVVAGWDFVDNDADPMDTNGHGTGVAGAAAANPFVYAGEKYQGVAPGANLIALRVDLGNDAFVVSRYDAALKWVLAHQAEYNIVAVNMSTGYGTFPSVTTVSPISDDLAQLASAGIFVCASSGNDGVTKPASVEFPAADPNCYAIGSVDASDVISSFTSRSADLDLLAPGENVPIPYLGTNGSHIYLPGTGTSFASPFAAGAAALLKQLDPSYTPEVIRSILADSGKPNKDGDAEVNPVTRLTFPRLDLDNALALAARQSLQVPGTIQFEDYDRGGEGVAYHDTDKANNGGAYRYDGVDIENGTGGGYDVGYVKAGEWLNYTVNVTSAGAYDVQFRVADAAPGGTFHLALDGQDITGPITVPSTGGWQNWTLVTRSNLQFAAAGQHSLRIIFDTNGTGGFVGNFDWMKFTASAGAVPEAPYLGTAYVPGDTIQAEDFNSGGEGVAYHDSDAANLGGAYRPDDGVDIEGSADTGGGYDVGYAQAGEYLDYTINISAGGNYDMDFRVASASAGGTFHVEIDGANVTGTMSVPNTGGWQTWQTITRSAVSLTAGQHILRLCFDSNGASGFVGNFNWLKLRTSTPIIVVANGLPGTIQFEDYNPGGEGVGYHDTDAANDGGLYRPSEGVDIETASDAVRGYSLGWVKAGEWLKYDVNVATSGAYNFDVRLASAAAGGKFHIEVDGVNATGSLSVPNTGGWQKWSTITAKGVSLTAGAHTLRVVFDTANSTGYVGNFNYMNIGAAPSLGAAFTAGQTIQAEDFDSGGEGVSYHDADTANLGGAYRTAEGVDLATTTDTAGGYYAGWTKAGEWMQYSVGVAAAGPYTFSARVASPAAGGAFHVEFDGVNLTGPIALPNTGGWQNWQTISFSGINLTPGIHVVRIVLDTNSASGYVGNFNWFKVG